MPKVGTAPATRWKKEFIKVNVVWTSDDKRTVVPQKDRTVLAETIGGLFAVHRDACPENKTGLVSVTHLRTGMRACSVKDEVDARAIAELLYDNFRSEFEQADKVDPPSVPKSVVNWLRECTRKGEMVDLS